MPIRSLSNFFLPCTTKESCAPPCVSETGEPFPLDRETIQKRSGCPSAGLLLLRCIYSLQLGDQLIPVAGISDHPQMAVQEAETDERVQQR